MGKNADLVPDARWGGEVNALQVAYRRISARAQVDLQGITGDRRATSH